MFSTILTLLPGERHGGAAGGRIQGHQVQPGDRVEEQLPQNKVPALFLLNKCSIFDIKSPPYPLQNGFSIKISSILSILEYELLLVVVFR